MVHDNEYMAPRKKRTPPSNEYMAHIYAAFPKNYLKIFLFISGCHSIAKSKIQGTILHI